MGIDIAEISLHEGRATGAYAVDGQVFAAERIICNGDPPTVYAQMLPGANQRKRALPESMTQYSMGLYVLFFGTRKQYSDVAHHTIWMGKRYRELLDDIFHRQLLADDFSLYVHRPTATDRRLHQRDMTVFTFWRRCLTRALKSIGRSKSPSSVHVSLMHSAPLCCQVLRRTFRRPLR